MTLLFIDFVKYFSVKSKPTRKKKIKEVPEKL